jgi:hypothetical protein
MRNKTDEKNTEAYFRPMAKIRNQTGQIKADSNRKGILKNKINHL